MGDVVRHLAISRSTLQRRFPAIVGRSIHDEIVRVRLERAQELLATTPMPIGQIARTVGFRHEAYMSVVFRKKLGFTPPEVRRGKTAQPAKRRRG